MRRLLVLVCFALWGSIAYAEPSTIAMLPLDGEKRLEIYGQPVAAEIGRALKAAGLDVVVVGARMDVPDRAQLIVDGTIKSAKNKQIELSIRVRDPRDGTVLDTLPAPPTKLDDLDKAAAELSARVVPWVKTQLEKLAKPAVVDRPITEPKQPSVPAKPHAPAQPVIATTVLSLNYPEATRLRGAFDRVMHDWQQRQHFAAKVRFNVLSYAPEDGTVPMARARVRVEIHAGDKKLFDRVVRTDTVVGDPKSTHDELAERTAREVLAIARAHLHRVMRR
jgi:hypothetical protein